MTTMEEEEASGGGDRGGGRVNSNNRVFGRVSEEDSPRCRLTQSSSETASCCYGDDNSRTPRNNVFVPPPFLSSCQIKSRTFPFLLLLCVFVAVVSMVIQEGSCGASSDGDHHNNIKGPPHLLSEECRYMEEVVVPHIRSGDDYTGGVTGSSSSSPWLSSSSSSSSSSHAMGGSSTDPNSSESLCVSRSSSSTVTPPTTNSNSTTTSCCPRSLIPLLLSSSSDLVRTAFNNTPELEAFRSSVDMHLPVMAQYSPIVSTRNNNSSEALWNATIDGLGVLREWGLKFWDPEFLLKSNVFTAECLTRVLQGHVCGACEAGRRSLPPAKTCKSLCQNTVIECLKFPLGEFIEAPWKHAVNSVRTAVRLVMTTSAAEQDTSILQSLVNDLNDWREPISWWIHDYKSVRACEDLPSNGCWNGERIAPRYDVPVLAWRAGFRGTPGGGNKVQPEVIGMLDAFRNKLVQVRKSLEKYWPTTPPSTRSTHHHQEHHALPFSSLEDPYPYPPHDLIHSEGSGHDGNFESDDEDLEYSNSGYGPHDIDTDDEDLVGGIEGSGSGGGYHDNDGDNLFDNNNNGLGGGGRTTVGGDDTTSGGGSSSSGRPVGISSSCTSSPLCLLLLVPWLLVATRL